MVIAEENGRAWSAAPPRVDAFLDAKLSPPSPRSEWVRRPDLVDLVTQGLDCPLTLITAPAGYGKTTLVAQWLAQLQDRAAAWVGLDAADDDPVRLWTHVATAITRAGCWVAPDVGRFVASNQSDIVSVVLPAIIAALADGGQRTVLVLDDLHVVRAASCLEQLDVLIEYLPPSAAIVITTRADPALRLGRLRAAGRLAEIRADRLTFGAAEAAALLAASGVQLGSAASGELLTRTEGWPAGLYLAALTLSGRSEPDDLVHRISGDDRFIGEYLTEEVLARQSGGLRAFITSASIFERFCADLCDHVLRTRDSSSRLRELERSNLFLVPLDSERRWYRFHSLFASVARNELELEDPVQARQLHARAADWFADQGFVDEAITHALRAGAPSLASRLLQANWLRYVDAGRAATVRGWLQDLDVPGPTTEPGTMVTAAWIAVLTGDESSGTQIMRTLSEARDDVPLPDGTRSPRSAVAIIRSTIGFGGPPEMLTAGRLAAELETDPASPWYASANLGLGHAHYLIGDLDCAMAALPRAGYSDVAPAIIKVYALAAMAMVQLERGNPDSALRLAEESMAVVDTRSMHGMPQISMAFTALGECQAVTGSVGAGLSTLEKGLALRRKVPGLSPWPTIHQLLAMGRVATIAGDLGQAAQLLDEAEQRMSRFDDGMEAMRTRLSSARSALRRRRLPELTGESLTEREADVLRHLQTTSSLAEIASAMYLSRNTVKTHVRAVYQKLGVGTRAEAVRLGRERGLI